MMEPTTPAVANSTAQAPVAAPGTSRGPDVAAYRAMQSMNARLNAMGSQLQQMGAMLTEQQQRDAEAADVAFRERVRARLDSGEISATDAAMEVAEHVANRRAAAAAMVAAPQPPPVDVNDVQRRIGQESILRGFGLSGSEPGLIFDTPQELVASAQRIVAARGAAAQPQQGVDHDELVAEAARRQGMVIPHRDGGRAAPFNQPVTSQDVARLAWGYSSKRNPPARLRQQIESMRQNGRAPTVSTGETGYQPTPENFARISSGQNPR